ncbi:MAG: glycosyltransferase [Bacteroidales bacterium]|jgi:cellulose synthase/poly-beta-1,6-N-acetylglucosamine synthase-like glycosyltransferase|nr:glycosyltransferase [Bacteroidales bacterium]
MIADIFIILSSTIILLYMIMISMFAFAWFLRKENISSKKTITKKISVIVAFRNEEKNLDKLLKSLLNQSYKDYEIILINDHSNDNSTHVINQIKNEKIKLYDLPDEFQGKKHALRYGAKHSDGEILFFTDADCIIPPEWISETYSYMLEKDIKMLCGPVRFYNNPGIFSKLVQLEFLSMTGSGAAGTFLGLAFMCNGANYAIEKNIFSEASAFFNDKYSSGDDVFLLHYVSGKYKVDFIKNRKCIIDTKAPENLKELFVQRVRWASKTSGYKTPVSIITAALTFLMSFILLVSLIAGFFKFIYIYLFITAFFIKIFTDTLFMIPVLNFYRKSNLIWFIPLLQIFYPFYIVITGILSLFWHPLWKGRRVK